MGSKDSKGVALFLFCEKRRDTVAALLFPNTLVLERPASSQLLSSSHSPLTLRSKDQNPTEFNGTQCQGTLDQAIRVATSHVFCFYILGKQVCEKTAAAGLAGPCEASTWVARTFMFPTPVMEW